MLTAWQNSPDSGTLFEYVGENAQVYRCPSIQPGVLGSGVGSNGRYDRTMVGGFGGTRLDNLPLRVWFRASVLDPFLPLLGG